MDGHGVVMVVVVEAVPICHGTIMVIIIQEEGMDAMDAVIIDTQPQNHGGNEQQSNVAGQQQQWDVQRQKQRRQHAYQRQRNQKADHFLIQVVEVMNIITSMVTVSMTTAVALVPVWQFENKNIMLNKEKFVHFCKFYYLRFINFFPLTNTKNLFLFEIRIFF